MKKMWPKYWLTRLHRDDRGNIGTLLLLTMFVLVGLLALVWNTADVGARRQIVQTAADSAAHSATTWTSRTLNAVTAQNMVIAQDASAETIWRAVPAADTGVDTGSRFGPGTNWPWSPGKSGIKGELNAELALANAMLKRPWMAGALRQLKADLANVYTEQAQTQQAFATVSGSYLAEMPDPLTANKFAVTLRQSTFATNWINNTYLGGNMPNPQNIAPAAPLPGPPRERDGQGNVIAGTPAGLVPLTNYVLQNIPTKAETQVLNLIIRYINSTEIPILVSFEQRTQPATNQNVGQQMAQHEQEVFSNQTQMVLQTPTSIEQQRDSLATFYRVDTTLACMQNTPDQTGPAAIPAPCVPANTPQSISVTDTISGQTVVVDPINPQTNSPATGDASITYPDPVVQIPMVGSYELKCNVPGGWGHIWAMPVERYFNDRVWNDQQTIRNTYMVTLDNSRNNCANPLDLKHQIELLLNTALDSTIDDLPGFISDNMPDPNNNDAYDNIPVLPGLTAPGTSSAKFRTAVDLYNQHAGKFTGAVRRLRWALLSFVMHYDRFTRSFAVDTWSNAVSNARDYVVEQLGTNKCFMVLSTYKLHYIPDQWQAGMRDSAAMAIRDQIVEMNIGGITQSIVSSLIGGNARGLGSGILDATTKQNMLYGAYIGQASQLATAALTQAATPVAQAIAQDWVSRPWPYELTPTTDPIPPAHGMGKDDRQQYFTVLSAARENANTPTHFLLAKFLGFNQPSLFAYAQAETFNWMEYNGAYGGNERYDQVTTIPYGYGYGWNWGSEYIPVPRGWRLCTIGGWNWQPRLAFADALSVTLPNNTEMTDYFTQAGVTPSAPVDGGVDSLETLNNH